MILKPLFLKKAPIIFNASLSPTLEILFINSRAIILLFSLKILGLSIFPAKTICVTLYVFRVFTHISGLNNETVSDWFKKEVGSEKPSIHITNALGFSFAIYLGRSPLPAI